MTETLITTRRLAELEEAERERDDLLRGYHAHPDCKKVYIENAVPLLIRERDALKLQVQELTVDRDNCRMYAKQAHEDKVKAERALSTSGGKTLEQINAENERCVEQGGCTGDGVPWGDHVDGFVDKLLDGQAGV